VIKQIPESALVVPALECLYAAGGRISTTDLLQRFEDRFQSEGETTRFWMAGQTRSSLKR
jgi:hypothetical protein